MSPCTPQSIKWSSRSWRPPLGHAVCRPDHHDQLKNSESCLKQLIKRNIFINSYGFRPKKSEINPKKNFSLKFLLSSATLCSKISGSALTELSGFKNPPVQGFKSNYGRNLQKIVFLRKFLLSSATQCSEVSDFSLTE